MPRMRSYRDLVAWQKAMDLVQEVYAATREWPRREAFGLTSQVRRAAVSVPSNIAEGYGRQSSREFLNYLSIAYGSLMELETQLLIGFRLGYGGHDRGEPLLAAQRKSVGSLTGFPPPSAKP
jgi:four helix bundle protein